MILPLLLAAAQPLPRAEPLPPPVSEETAVLATVDGLFAALTARDKPRALGFFRPDGGAQAVVERPDGTRRYRHMGWAEFIGGIPDAGPRFVERLTDRAVEIDGDIAMVWGGYVAEVDGKLVHCGTDHFDLVREGGGWKVLNITWTQRTAGCPAA